MAKRDVYKLLNNALSRNDDAHLFTVQVLDEVEEQVSEMLCTAISEWLCEVYGMNEGDDAVIDIVIELYRECFGGFRMPDREPFACKGKPLVMKEAKPV